MPQMMYHAPFWTLKRTGAPSQPLSDGAAPTARKTLSEDGRYWESTTVSRKLEVPCSE